MDINKSLFYTTTRIIVSSEDQQSVGTGFFFQLSVDNNNYPVLITNKHVLFYKTVVDCIIEVHSDKSDKEQITIKNSQWFFHPSEDLAFMFVNDVFVATLFSNNKKIKNVFLTEQNLISENDFKSLNAFEDVIMVGYPRAIYDEKNNLPIIRKGFTASMIGSDYNGKKQGLIDISIIYGSSGSPIFIIKQYLSGQLTIKNDFIKLLGINFSGEIFDYPVSETTANKEKVTAFINLARYVKAECLLDFKPIIRNYINQDKFK